LEFAKSLRDPGIYNAVRNAEPLTPIYTYRATENRQHHLHLLKDWPEGLIVVGDAACAFNPVYAQGMSTAAIEAARLHSLLCDSGALPELGHLFQQEIARIVQSPWILATSADLRYRSVEGARASRKTRVMHWYLDRVLRLGTTDKWVRRRFLEVQGMLLDASAILKLDIMFRVLLGLVRSRLSRHPAPYLYVSGTSAIDLSNSEHGQSTDVSWNHMAHPDPVADMFAGPCATSPANDARCD
jgi:hypothetical protein